MKIKPKLLIYIGVLIFFLLWNWYRVNYRKTPTNNFTSVDNTESIQFNLKELSSIKTSKGETKTWLANYSKNNKTAQFRLELTLKEPNNKAGIVFTKGVFYHELNSDSSKLIPDLARVLEAKQIPTNVEKINSLSFEAAILGTNLSKGPGKEVRAGSFNSDKKGSWTVTKVFIGKDQAEFFLAVDPTKGIGEISIKDPEYGNEVIAELVKIL